LNKTACGCAVETIYPVQTARCNITHFRICRWDNLPGSDRPL
jgi:hypothetical protein